MIQTASFDDELTSVQKAMEQDQADIKTLLAFMKKASELEHLMDVMKFGTGQGETATRHLNAPADRVDFTQNNLKN